MSTQFLNPWGSAFPRECYSHFWRFFCGISTKTEKEKVLLGKLGNLQLIYYKTSWPSRLISTLARSDALHWFTARQPNVVLADRIKPVQTSLILCRQSQMALSSFKWLFVRSVFTTSLKCSRIGKGRVGGPHRGLYLHTKRPARVKIFSSMVASGKTGWRLRRN